MGPLLGFILLFVFGVAVVFFFTRVSSSIPTLVNCWYCNHNVFLPANGLENIERWKCPVCDSLNVRNKTGELIDSIPEMYDPTLNQQSRVSRRMSAKNSTDVLCSNCDLAQQRILAYVTSFDPEDNDKNYLQHANAFKRKLEERYPLCSMCQHKVDNIISERDKVAKSLMIDRCRQQLHAKPVVAIPSRQQARRNFYIQGILFWTLHMATIALSLRAIVWPNDTIDMLQNGNYVYIPSIITSVVSIDSAFSVSPSIIALFVSIFSAWWVFWHPQQMEVYGYTGKFIPRQKTYMVSVTGRQKLECIQCATM
ncbi:Ima1 N-terminal domain-containing protein [Umbelopsis sp. PMI_123]|nr:Ima1 N-terminal domain-containing protein [Umbelopsis sp. PMI_123]